MILLMKVYQKFANLHRKLYEIGALRSIKVNKFVISVGNITFGGTGKTPFVKSLTEELRALGKKPAVIVRSYRGTLQDSVQMDQAQSNQPRIYGDEACWYFQNISCPVFTGPAKYKSAQLASEISDIDILVIDDGFQHHKLQKNINIVLVDAVAGSYGLSKARECARALEKAHALVLTRSNLVAKEKLFEFKKILPEAVPIFYNQTVFKRIRNLQGRSIELKDKKVGLVSGIAHPETFEIVFRDQFPTLRHQSLRFSDHHDYDYSDLVKIESWAEENSLDFVIMTEKDEVKLKGQMKNPDKFLVLEIESMMENPDLWRKFLKGQVP